MKRIDSVDAWQKEWKKGYAAHKKLDPAFDAEVIEHLEFYCAHGECKRKNPWTVNPPLKSWQHDLDRHLKTYAQGLLYELAESWIEGRFDRLSALRAYAAMHTYTFIETSLGFESFERNGEFRTIPSQFSVPFIGLGMLIGCHGDASRLAKMLLISHRQKLFWDQESYPIYQLMLRLMAAHLDEADLELTGEPAQEISCLELFKLWRSQDLHALESSCLAVLDFHTSRYRTSPKYQTEFDSGPFAFLPVPIEVLLLMKLRDMHGLSNPVLAHSLMSPVFSDPIPEAKFEELSQPPDTLIFRLRSRMQQDGYDEDALYRNAKTVHSKAARPMKSV